MAKDAAYKYTTRSRYPSQLRNAEPEGERISYTCIVCLLHDPVFLQERKLDDPNAQGASNFYVNRASAKMLKASSTAVLQLFLLGDPRYENSALRLWAFLTEMFGIELPQAVRTNTVTEICL
jgi:hypothetical protein